MIRVPVLRRERQRRAVIRAHSSFGRITHRDRYVDLGRRLARQFHREGRSRSRFAHRTARRRHHEARRFIIGRRHRNILGIKTVITHRVTGAVVRIQTDHIGLGSI